MPDFFIVGHPKSGTTALYEMLRRHPQIYMPELKEPCFSPATCARCSAARRTPARTRSRSTCALFAGARREQRAGEASPSYLRSRDAPPGEIAQLQPDGAHHRDPARAGQLPALAAPAAAAGPRRGREGSAQGALEARARKAHRRGPDAACAALLRARALRRAAAPLPRGVRARAGAGADLRRLPRRQRGDRAARAALPRSGRTRPGADRDVEANAGGPRHALAAISTAWLRTDLVGQETPSRVAASESIRTITPTGCAAAPRGRRRRVVYGSPAARRGADARAAPALQRRGGGAQRVPRTATSWRCGAMAGLAERPMAKSQQEPGRGHALARAAESAQEAAMPSGQVVVTCPAPRGGGLGRHLREILEALDRRQQPVSICGILRAPRKPWHPALTTALAPLARVSPAWRSGPPAFSSTPTPPGGCRRPST